MKKLRDCPFYNTLFVKEQFLKEPIIPYRTHIYNCHAQGRRQKIFRGGEGAMEKDRK